MTDSGINVLSFMSEEGKPAGTPLRISLNFPWLFSQGFLVGISLVLLGKCKGRVNLLHLMRVPGLPGSVGQSDKSRTHWSLVSMGVVSTYVSPPCIGSALKIFVEG